MPKRLPDTRRRKILADIEAGAKSCGQIARDHAVSRSTVSKLAKDHGAVGAFERTQTVKAARAKQADNKVRRAEAQRLLLDDFHRLRARAWSAYKLPMATAKGVEIVELDLPPLESVRACYTSIGICIDKDLAYERLVVGDSGTEHAKSMLGRLFTGLADAVASEPAETADDGD